MKKEILKFHYEEIVFVLMILSTNLKDYLEDDLKNFAEAIHNMDHFSNSDFLKMLNQINPKFDDELISNFIVLQGSIAEIYSGQWYKKLAIKSDKLIEISILSRMMLNKLDEEYIEPNKYAENNMDVTW